MGLERKKDKKRKKPYVKLTEEQLREKLTNKINKLVSDNDNLLSQKDKLVDLMKQSHQATQYHLTMVKKTCGTIEEEDVKYCVQLSERIINNFLKNGA